KTKNGARGRQKAWGYRLRCRSVLRFGVHLQGFQETRYEVIRRDRCRELDHFRLTEVFFRAVEYRVWHVNLMSDGFTVSQNRALLGVERVQIAGLQCLDLCRCQPFTQTERLMRGEFITGAVYGGDSQDHHLADFARKPALLPDRGEE